MKKLLGIVALALSAAICLSSCTFVVGRHTIGDDIAMGNEFVDKTPDEVGEESPLKGSLELQIWTNENEDMATAWTDVVDAFEEQTGVKVTMHIGSQVVTQMASRWLGDNPPDIALVGSSFPVESYERNGTLLNLEEVLKNENVFGTSKKIWDCVNHDIFERNGPEAPYYRAGLMAGPYGVIYDRNYLQELGLEAPRNYTQLMEFSSSVIAQGKQVFTTYGNTGSYPTSGMIIPALAAYGREFLDDILMGKASAWSSTEAQTVLTKWNTFCTTKNVLLDGTPTFDHTTSQIEWLKHKAALIGNGIWLPGEVQNITPSGFEMEYISSPLIEEGQKETIVAWPTSLVVSAKSKGDRKTNALAFVRFLYTRYAQARLAGGYGYAGARTDLDYTESPWLSSASQDMLTYIYSGKADVYFKRYTWGELNDTINGATHSLMTGSKSVSAVIQDIVNRSNALFPNQTSGS